jgi:hypothetical protein
MINKGGFNQRMLMLYLFTFFQNEYKKVLFALSDITTDDPRIIGISKQLYSPAKYENE